MRVVGLDLSMTSTGYAECCGQQFATATIQTERARTPKGKQPSLVERHDRLQVVEDRIITRIYRHTPAPDLVVVEGPSYASTGFMQHDISGNWWRVVGRLHQAGLRVVEVTPTQVKKYATGSGATRGKTKVEKWMVVEAVNARYELGPIQLTRGQNDQADAVILAAIGCRILGHPVDPHISTLNLKVLTEIRLPEGLTLK